MSPLIGPHWQFTGFRAPWLLTIFSLLASTALALTPREREIALPIVDFELLEILPLGHPADESSLKSRSAGFTFVAFGKRFDVELRPGKLFSPGAETVWLGKAGKQYREKSATVTISGQVRGEEGSTVHLMSLESGLEGVIVTESGTLFLEPAGRYLPTSRSDQTLAYRLELGQSWSSSSCGADDLDKWEGAARAGVDRSSPRAAVRPSKSGSLLPSLQLAALDAQGTSVDVGLLEVELLLFVDHYYFKRYSWESAERVHGLIHQVNGIFEKEMGVTFRITETRISTASSEDPVGVGGDSTALLTQLSDHKLQGPPIWPISSPLAT